MNRKQRRALMAGVIVGLIVAVAVPEKVIGPLPAPQTHMLPDGSGTVVVTDAIYTPRKASLTGIALVTLITVLALRKPKSPRQDA